MSSYLEQVESHAKIRLVTGMYLELGTDSKQVMNIFGSVQLTVAEAYEEVDKFNWGKYHPDLIPWFIFDKQELSYLTNRAGECIGLLIDNNNDYLPKEVLELLE